MIELLDAADGPLLTAEQTKADIRLPGRKVKLWPVAEVRLHENDAVGVAENDGHASNPQRLRWTLPTVLF